MDESTVSLFLVLFDKVKDFLLDQLSAIVVAAILTPVVMWLRRKSRDQSAIIEHKDKQNTELAQTNATLTARVKLLEAELPRTSIDNAQSERAVGNDAGALSALRKGFEHNRARVRDLCIELAEHHAAVMLDAKSADLEWRDARRMAEIAARLSPEDSYSCTLAAELEAMGPPPWTEDSRPQAEREHDEDYLYRGLGAGAKPLVEHLVGHARPFSESLRR